MEPSERRCANCATYRDRQLRVLAEVVSDAAGRDPTGTCCLTPAWKLTDANGFCSEHRTAAEQARLWAARDTEACVLINGLAVIEADAAARECAAVVAWLRGEGEDGKHFAAAIERGEHRRKA